MELKDKVNLLLSMQEHPEKYTDEQLAQMLADDPELEELLEQLSLTKTALVKVETEKEEIPLDNHWKQFALRHADELSHLDTNHKKKTGLLFSYGSKISKIAAVFIAVIFVAGLAYAALHVINIISSNKLNTPERETPLSIQENTLKLGKTFEDMTMMIRQQDTIISADTFMVGAVVDDKPIVFDNITLEKMLLELSDYYHLDVEFQNDEVRQLRFYFVWNHEETVETVINRLNRFESINVEIKENKIVVR